MNFTSARDFAREVTRATQDAMLEQLGELVKSGVLVWEETQQMIIKDQFDPYKFHISNNGKFVFKDAEVIRALREENAHLKARLAIIQETVLQ